jgi:hypothetical protein
MLVLGIELCAGSAIAQVINSDGNGGLSLKVVGSETEVFQADPDHGCGPTDIPDGPARAVKLRQGKILMMASSAENFPFWGTSLLTIKKSCKALFHGEDNDNPAAFNDRAWLLTPFSLDGRHIVGLVHNEFQGHRRKWLCPDGKYTSCWYNSITAVISNDGGKSFVRPQGRSFLVAAPRYPYEEMVGKPAGYFGLTNIVPYKGGYAFLIYQTRFKDQRPGVCVMKSETPMDFASWRAYDGQGFYINLSGSPYILPASERPKPCYPVAQKVLRWPISGIAFHRTSGTYLALMVGIDKTLGAGIFYATSRDLIDWSGPNKLISSSVPSQFKCGQPEPHIYPSLLDPNSDDQNYGTIGDHPILFSTVIPIEDCHLQILKGRLIRQFITVNITQTNPELDRLRP